ncbi:MAG: class I SAM-dependent methyltransferase [Flavobacteriales bacterium]|nr:class I SAM-dependent methyltransferase [Flavobacteriales bacterium]
MKHSYFKIPGWFNYSETYDIIVDQIKDDGKIVEIGSFMGRSTHYLATSLYNANKSNVKIYSVDTFQGSSEHATLNIPQDFKSIFEKNLDFFIERGMVIPCQGRSDSQEILDKFEDESLDYIMVDGAHEYEPVMDDIENWWPKLKQTGTMFGDDYLLESVKQACLTSFGKMKMKNLGANQSMEQTWYASKDLENNSFFQKLVPGQNTLK